MIEKKICLKKYIKTIKWKDKDDKNKWLIIEFVDTFISRQTPKTMMTNT
jgi:hypothetical protein